MADLIDRQAAIEKLTNNLTFMHTFGADRSIDLIEELPSVEAEPARHGHWIRGSGYPHRIFCSICYATYVPNDEWDIWKTDGSDCFRLQRNFCPYCGADMRGE